LNPGRECSEACTARRTTGCNANARPVQRQAILEASPSPASHSSVVTTHPSHRAPHDRHSVAQLTVLQAHGDLLEVEPLDLGPGAPATIALEQERGPIPDDAAQRGHR
jgi:hypothetical protein